MRREAKAWVATGALGDIGANGRPAPDIYNLAQLSGWGRHAPRDEGMTEVTVSWDEPDPEPAVGQERRDSGGYVRRILHVDGEDVMTRRLGNDWRAAVYALDEVRTWELVR